MAKILIVEDDLSFGTLIQTWLRKKGFEVEKATSVKGALLLLEKDGDRDLILSDFRLPDHDGLAVLKWAQDHNLRIPFIVMTSYAEVQNAVLAMKAGATDYIAKPFQPDILLEKIQEALRAHASSQPPTSLSDASAPAAQPTNGTTEGGDAVPRYIEGKSEASRRLYDFVSLVAPTPMSVLILGASGTGKEYVARRIHALSPRADKPFFALDCGAIPREVAASEFFGYVKGAFTGADQDKKGAFETANGGTLFLDEMGNLNYEVQVQLLRALQERKIRPVGSTHEIDIDLRLVCATNENLEQRVAEGKFREDHQRVYNPHARPARPRHGPVSLCRPLRPTGQPRTGTPRRRLRPKGYRTDSFLRVARQPPRTEQCDEASRPLDQRRLHRCEGTGSVYEPRPAYRPHHPP
mgnify:CR=1 FL=1